MHRNLECSEAEWEARRQLAACYRIFDHLGWSESIYNHISLRVPGEDNAFLINPFGLLYSEVCASNLVKIDIDGNKLDDSPWPVNQAGFVQHSYFHRHVPWAHAICHTHTVETMAVCSLEGGLQPINFYASTYIGHLAYHDFEGVTVRPEEGARLLANLGDKRVLMLRNHGPVVLSPTLPEMFLTYYMLQRACEVQCLTLAMGKPIVVPPEVLAVHQRDILQATPPGGPGVGDFEAWVRRIDKVDRSWRD
ncbi:MAG: class II aldolase/adducin family protein [Sphingomonadales bacterium]|nr:class II aldolase/adducin family protein [Sphingomonadales bacterium]